MDDDSTGMGDGAGMYDDSAGMEDDSAGMDGSTGIDSCSKSLLVVAAFLAAFCFLYLFPSWMFLSSAMTPLLERLYPMQILKLSAIPLTVLPV